MPLWLLITIAVGGLGGALAYLVYCAFRSKKDHPNVEGPY